MFLSDFLQAAPINRCQSVLDKVGIGARKRPAAEEATAGGKGAWVWAFDDVVAAGVDEGDFSLRVGTPEDEHHGCFTIAKFLNDGIGEGFPTVAGMALWTSLGNGKGGVQQQHTLFRPTEEATMVRARAANIVLQLLENIQQ